MSGLAEVTGLTRSVGCGGEWPGLLPHQACSTAGRTGDNLVPVVILRDSQRHLCLDPLKIASSYPIQDANE